jgi:uncharacterized OsmC-like protein
MNDGAGSLESDTHPIGFVTREGVAPAASGRSGFRCEVMGLAGLQKEGLVEDVGTGRTWRLASDEGVYLNGTDLAPAPLMYWAAGALADVTSSIVDAATSAGISVAELTVTSSQEFGLDGSFVRAEAVASAGTLDLQISVMSDATEEALAEVVELALRTSAAAGAVSASVEGQLALSVNGRVSVIESHLSDPETVAVRARSEQDPFHRYARRPEPEAGRTPPQDIVVRLPDLSDTTSRTGPNTPGRIRFLVAATTTWRREASPQSVCVEFPGAGTAQWTIAYDVTGDAAPSPVALMSIGAAFCFHTQLARLVKSQRVPLDAPRLVQNTEVHERDGGALVSALNTTLFVSGQVDVDAATRIAAAAQASCFAHQSLARASAVVPEVSQHAAR